MHSSTTPLKLNGRKTKNKNKQVNKMVKPNNFKKSYVQLFKYAKGYALMIIFALLLSVIGTALRVIGPNKISEIINIIKDGLGSAFNLNAIYSLCILIAILYVTSTILSYIEAFVMTTITQAITKKMRTDISQKINKVPLKYFDKTTYGDVLSRVINDVDTIAQTLNMSVTTLVSSVALFLGSLIMMFVTNWMLAITAIISTIIGFSLMVVIISKSQKYFITQQRELGEINGHIEEIYSGHNVVKAYNGEKKAKQIFEKINDKLYVSGWKSQFMSGLMMPLMGFIGNFGFVMICVVGGALAFSGIISFGVVVSFMIYIRLFTQPLSQIAQSITSLQSTAAANNRVFEFLNESELEDESNKSALLLPEDVVGNVEFINVNFGYSEDKTIIKNFSAVVKAGQKIAIVGPTGAGKTTMVNLLMRFYEINGGEIKIDGVPISSLTRENVHNLFCMVLQDTWLFEGTIKENLIYSKENISDEAIIAACNAVGLHHFVETLPNGYNTVLNDKATISAGQKQLLTIARAMVENAPLLILDEATSSVDTRSEVLIQQAMDKLTEGRTSFVIAHRLSTIKNADLILVMRDGDIIESGNHTALIKKNGFYADLYNSQFEKETA